MKSIFRLFVVFFIALSGCAKITHGDASSGNYTSSRAEYTLATPANWYATVTPPTPDLEAKIEDKIVRPRELGYFIKSDGTAAIVIETHELTWAGNPLLTSEIAWGHTGPVKFKEVCDEFTAHEQEKFSSNFKSFTFECLLLEGHKSCDIAFPCLTLTKEMVSLNEEGTMILEKVYIFDTISLFEVVTKQDPTGWRVHFTLSSPPDDYQQNQKTLGEIINSMQPGTLR